MRLEEKENTGQKSNNLTQKFGKTSSFSGSKPEKNIHSLTIKTTNLDQTEIQLFLHKLKGDGDTRKVINSNFPQSSKKEVAKTKGASNNQENNNNLKKKRSKDKSFNHQKKQSFHQKQNAKKSTKSGLFYLVIVLLVVSILFLIISFHLEKNKKLQKKPVSRIVNV